jgi:hypothetical protein
MNEVTGDRLPVTEEAHPTTPHLGHRSPVTGN